MYYMRKEVIIVKVIDDTTMATFVDNAMYLAKSKGTIRQFENYCGVSVGYFSRLLGPAKHNALSFHTALLMVKYLETDINTLLNPSLKRNLEAKRLQEAEELLAQKRLDLVNEEEIAQKFVNAGE